MTNVMPHASGFKASYVWPNAAFPFRVYHSSKKCRVFIIENIQHNWNWLLEWHDKIRDTDFFFVYCGWYHSPAFAREAHKIFELLKLQKSNFFIMFNSPEEMENFRPFEFQGDVINHNAWLDEAVTMRPLSGIEKKFDAIYVGRRSAFKRHMLAEKVARLALVAGINHGNNISPVPDNPAFINDTPLSPEHVCHTINQSHCGLILSAIEGACFASSEYLLCGVPVVSTPSQGGRDVWYNGYNSIVCDPDPEAVAEAVDFFCRHRPDPRAIRAMHIEQAKAYRTRFIMELQSVFDRFGEKDTDATKYFERNFKHKLRASYKPDFAEIFG
ncbi:MAG: glycosyltransferase [Rhodobacteraceae bacterium]|nr:glycosyltransferase [Paracoccaceae bacterium]